MIACVHIFSYIVIHRPLAIPSAHIKHHVSDPEFLSIFHMIFAIAFVAHPRVIFVKLVQHLLHTELVLVVEYVSLDFLRDIYIGFIHRPSVSTFYIQNKSVNFYGTFFIFFEYSSLKNLS